MEINSLNICGVCSNVNRINSKAVILDLSLNTGLTLIQNKFNLCFPDLDFLTFSKIDVCENCIETIDKAYKFRNLCFETEKQLMIHMEMIDINSLQILKSIQNCESISNNRDSHPSVVNVIKNYCSEIKQKVHVKKMSTNVQIKDCFNTCRICLEITKSGQVFPLNFAEPSADSVSIKYRLQLCCPEVDVNLIPGAVLCKKCFDALNIMYYFKTHCYKIEMQVKELMNDFSFSKFNESVQARLLKISSSNNINKVIPGNKKSEVVNTSKKPTKESDHNKSKNVRQKVSKRNQTPVQLKKLNPVYKCYVCGCRAKTKEELLKHKDVHKNESRFKCEHCNFTSNYKCNFKKHMDKLHKGKSSESVLRFIAKSKRNVNSKSLNCTKCSYSCKTRETLTKHMLVHQFPVKHKCIICNGIFNRKDYLNNHVCIHASVKPAKSTKPDIETSEILEGNIFKCSMCHYICKRRINFIAHKKSHSSNNAFACTLCKYRSLSSSCLQRHLLSHSDVRPFKCKSCDYRCKERYVLKKHERKHLP